MSVARTDHEKPNPLRSGLDEALRAVDAVTDSTDEGPACRCFFEIGMVGCVR